jgi:hypothetical protein
MRRLISARSAGLIAAITAVALAGTACSNNKSSTGTGGQAVNPNANAGVANSLKGVCPDKVVFQDDWTPQAEFGGIYRLLGENPTIDKQKKKVTGRLVDNGVDTGVQIEIRAGGQFVNFTPAAALLYTDNSITLGAADLDGAASNSVSKPTIGVFAPMDLSPVVLLWDPKTYPNFNTISDIGQTDTKVLYFPGSTYMSFLTGTGILRPGQVDPSYDGSPQKFVTAGGKAVQQGFLTNEVYSYQNEIPQWKKPVSWQLVSDAGYPNYPAMVSIRADRKAELTPCLKKLVPVLQRSTAGYLEDPTSTNTLLVSLVKAYDAFGYSEQRATAAVKAMKENGIVGNGSNKTIGDFDEARVQKIMDIVGPIFAGQKKPMKAGLKPTDLATNEFLDMSIGAKTT